MPPGVDAHHPVLPHHPLIGCEVGQPGYAVLHGDRQGDLAIPRGPGIQTYLPEGLPAVGRDTAVFQADCSSYMGSWAGTTVGVLVGTGVDVGVRVRVGTGVGVGVDVCPGVGSGATGRVGVGVGTGSTVDTAVDVGVSVESGIASVYGVGVVIGGDVRDAVGMDVGLRVGAEVCPWASGASPALVSKAFSVGGEVIIASGISSSPLQAITDGTSTSRLRRANTTLFRRAFGRGIHYLYSVFRIQFIGFQPLVSLHA